MRKEMWEGNHADIGRWMRGWDDAKKTSRRWIRDLRGYTYPMVRKNIIQKYSPSK